VSSSFALRLHNTPDAVIQEFRGGKYGSKTASCQRAAIFPQGFGGVHERTILLESLFLIRIRSRDPGQHFLA
jgi:hypothetical protein